MLAVPRSQASPSVGSTFGPRAGVVACSDMRQRYGQGMKHTHHLLLVTVVLAGGCSDVATPAEVVDPPLLPEPADTDESSDSENDDAEPPPDMPPAPPAPPREAFAVDHVTVLPGELLPTMVVVSAYSEGALVAELTMTSLQNNEVLEGVADFGESLRRKRESLYTGATEYAAEGKPIGEGVYKHRLAAIRDAVSPQVLASPCVDRFVSWLVSPTKDAGKAACECAAWLEVARPGDPVGLDCD